MGLGKLWQELKEARKSDSDTKLRLHKVLKLAEKVVFLVGQANVAVRHTRRVEILHCLTGNMKEARQLIKKYDSLLRDKELFGQTFSRKVKKVKAKAMTSGFLSLKTPTKPEYK